LASRVSALARNYAITGDPAPDKVLRVEQLVRRGRFRRFYEKETVSRVLLRQAGGALIAPASEILTHLDSGTHNKYWRCPICLGKAVDTGKVAFKTRRWDIPWDITFCFFLQSQLMCGINVILKYFDSPSFCRANKLNGMFGIEIRGVDFLQRSRKATPDHLVIFYFDRQVFSCLV